MPSPILGNHKAIETPSLVLFGNLSIEYLYFSAVIMKRNIILHRCFEALRISVSLQMKYKRLFQATELPELSIMYFFFYVIDVQ